MTEKTYNGATSAVDRIEAARVEEERLEPRVLKVRQCHHYWLEEARAVVCRSYLDDEADEKYPALVAAVYTALIP